MRSSFLPRRLVTALIVAGALLVGLVPAVAAADPMGTPRRTWAASFGSGGSGGSGALTSYVSAMGLLRLNVIGLPSNVAASARIHAGTCTNLRSVITEIGGLRTASGGILKRDIRVSAYRMNKVWATVQGGSSLALRVTTANASRCANLVAPVATRITVPALGIDLPIVRPPSTTSYPLCNVAEYLQVRWQPGEPGGTFIYAHARVGMFLPFLTESKKSRGGRLPGMLVYVYTSDSKVYTYRIQQVNRHQRYLPPPSSSSGRLWLQTSEGPRGTPQKLILVAGQVGVGGASYAASHPTPRPVRCG